MGPYTNLTDVGEFLLPMAYICTLGESGVGLWVCFFIIILEMHNDVGEKVIS